MINSEYEVFIKLGGTLDFRDLIQSRYQEIEDSDSFKNIPKDAPNRELILNVVALTTLAQDQVFIINFILKAKQALQDGDLTKAKFYLDCIFK